MNEGWTPAIGEAYLESNEIFLQSLREWARRFDSRGRENYPDIEGDLERALVALRIKGRHGEPLEGS